MSAFPPSFKRLALALGLGLLVYLGFAYEIAPNYWRHYEHQEGLASKSMVTSTGLGIPGDALNVGLEGAREDIVAAMREAGWRPADPVTVGSSVRIATSVIARRAYETAPVSALFWEGRRQDLAFEKPSGVSPSHRHHVRFWLALAAGERGAPVWLGGATFDRSVGVSHYTGQVTHHIGADIDAERDLLMNDLVASGHVEAIYQVGGVGPTLIARNGGGDPYFTDGEIKIARLRASGQAANAAPEVLPVSNEVKLRSTLFGGLEKLWRAWK